MKGLILSLNNGDVILQAHPLFRRFFVHKKVAGVHLNDLIESVAQMDFLKEAIQHVRSNRLKIFESQFPLGWLSEEFDEFHSHSALDMTISFHDEEDDGLLSVFISPIDILESYYSLLRGKDELYARSMQVLKQMSMMVINEPSTKVAARESLAAVRKLFNAESAIIRLLKYNGKLEKFVSDGVDGEYLKAHIEVDPAEVPLYAEVMASKLPVVKNNPTKELGVLASDLEKSHSSRLMVVAPIMNGSRVSGIFTLSFDHSNHLIQESMEILENVVNEFNYILERGNNILELLNTTEKLKTLNLAVVTSLSSAIETRDPYTKGHSERVAAYAVEIARNMGWDDYELERLRIAGVLHDVGKVGIPDAVLLKPDALTSNEFEIMKLHPEISAAIVSEINSFSELVPWIRYHHESMSGSGYPYGLKGNEIPMGARIIAVADSFDAMTSTRPYRKAMPLEKVWEILKEGAGSQWDREVIEIALDCLEVIVQEKKKSQYKVPDMLDTFRQRIFNTNLLDGLYLFTFVHDQIEKYMNAGTPFTLGSISLKEYIEQQPGEERKKSVTQLINAVKKHIHYPIQVSRYNYFEIIVLAPMVDKPFIKKIFNKILLEFFTETNLYFASKILSFPEDFSGIDEAFKMLLQKEESSINKPEKDL